MFRQIDTELQELKDILLEMGGAVEKAVEEACRAVVRRQAERLSMVHSLEKNINQLHLDVDRHCLALLAKQAPVARDLRLVLAIIKMNTDLERMGDQAINISYAAKDYMGLPALPEFVAPLEAMIESVRSMVRDSLDAFVRRDVEMSRAVLGRDDIVDRSKDQMVRSLTERMRADGNMIDSCMCLISVARNLERLADHSTNIAEDVIFFATGDDIRHAPKHEGTGF